MKIEAFLHPPKTARAGANTKARNNRKAKSSWVGWFAYGTLTDKREGLIVSYNDGKTCFYDQKNGYGEAVWAAMDGAESKGQFVWSVLMPAPVGSNTNYEIVSL